MLQLITNWLNGSREYFTGVVLYKKLPACNSRLVSLLNDGPTPLSREKLLVAMEQAIKDLQAPPKLTAPKEIAKIIEPLHEAMINYVHVDNPELYAACKIEADNLYKEVMNMRAELFAMTKMNDFVDPNLPDRIKAREILSIEVIKKYKQVSLLYDKADHVKKFGRLPYSHVEEDNGDEEIPDVMVKQQLDNLRKNYNKIKNRPPTPERLELLQKHELSIKNLEARWLLLKQ